MTALGGGGGGGGSMKILEVYCRLTLLNGTSAVDASLALMESDWPANSAESMLNLMTRLTSRLYEHL